MNILKPREREREDLKSRSKLIALIITGVPPVEDYY